MARIVACKGVHLCFLLDNAHHNGHALVLARAERSDRVILIFWAHGLRDLVEGFIILVEGVRDHHYSGTSVAVSW